jgi:hypothetical protein
MGVYKVTWRELAAEGDPDSICTLICTDPTSSKEVCVVGAIKLPK